MVREGKLQLQEHMFGAEAGPVAETCNRVTAVTVNFQICGQKQKCVFDNMSDLN